MKGVTRRMWRLAPALACGAAAQALAQAAPPVPAVSPLTVTAPPREDRKLKALPFSTLEGLTYRFVETHSAPAATIAQYTRWADPVCPRTQGLSAADNARVSQRIRDLAAEVRAPAATGACTPNVEVIVTDRPQPLMDRVAARKPIFLGYHFPSQTKAAVRMNRPIQAWYVTQTRGAGGAQVDIAAGGPTMGVSMMEVGQGPSGCAGSHFTECLKSEFDNVLIVVDAGKVKDQPLDAVADYAAMLALSRPASLDGCDDIPSILDLMSAACAGRPRPQALTPFDVDYLKALYQTDMAAVLVVERGNLAANLARIIKSAAADPK